MSPPSLPPPVFHLSDHSPAVNHPPVTRTPRYPVPLPVVSSSVSSSVPFQIPGFQSPLTVAYPDTTQAPVTQTFPQFMAFDTLFPKNSFSSVGTMPISLLIHSLVHALWWTSGLLRGMLTNYPLPPTLLLFDQIGRAVLMASPVWPGTQFNMDTDLIDLLADYSDLHINIRLN